MTYIAIYLWLMGAMMQFAISTKDDLSNLTWRRVLRTLTWPVAAPIIAVTTLLED